MSWDTSTPADSEAASQGASRLRELKNDLAAALTIEGSFPVSAASPQFYPKLKKDTTGNRPAASSDYPGRMFFNSTTGTFQRVKDDGSGWEDVYVNPATQSVHQAAGQAVASVLGVVTLNENGNSYNVSGTEAVTDVQGWSAGVAILKFTSARTLTHDASKLVLRNGISRALAAGEIVVLEFTGANLVREVAGSASPAVPTRQIFTSGSGTYTTPTGVRQIRVKMVGAGGGGGSGSSGTGSDGGAGSDTTFNSVSAKGGSGGLKGAASGVSVGGAGGTGGAGAATLRMPGNQGGAGGAEPSPNYGAASIFGGSVFAGYADGPGIAAAANTGAGGSGGNGATYQGAGGGSGEYAELWISAPAATYAYTVGAGGAASPTGTNKGGAGGSGIILVEEIY